METMRLEEDQQDPTVMETARLFVKRQRHPGARSKNLPERPRFVWRPKRISMIVMRSALFVL